MKDLDDLNAICMTMDHGYGLMSPGEQEKIRRRFAGIVDHHIAPLRKELEEQKALLSGDRLKALIGVAKCARTTSLLMAAAKDGEDTGGIRALHRAVCRLEALGGPDV